MQVSINTAVFLNQIQQGASQYQCLKQLVGEPLANVEVRGELFQGDTREVELDKIDQLCQKQSWDFYFSIPEELFTNGKLNQTIFDYLKLSERHHIRGLKISLGSFENLDENSLMKLRTALRDSEVKVTVENQPNINGTINVFKNNLITLLNKVPELGYTFDSGNWYWVNERPEEALLALKKDIPVFHLEELRGNATVMLDDGDTAWKSLVKNLDRTIPIFLEYDIVPDQLELEMKKVNDEIN